MEPESVIVFTDTERALIAAALRECLTAWPTYEPKSALIELARRVEAGGCS